MNKARRKEIYKIIDKLYEVLHMLRSEKEFDIESIITDIIELIQIVFDEEECVMDNIPENLQSGYRYQQSEEACDNLYDAIDTLESAVDDYDEDEDIDWPHIISEAIQSLNNAT